MAEATVPGPTPRRPAPLLHSHPLRRHRHGLQPAPEGGPRIAALVHEAPGDTGSVVNVGAGAGSCEPADRNVTAVEPSGAMIAQRPPGAAPVVKASAEALPFRDGAFDAALAVLTVHHWDDWRRGATEMRRVARRVVVVTWAPASEGFWLTWDYFPEVLAADRSEFPHIDALADALGGATIRTVPVPHDCTDGFGSAYWRRPGAYPAEALAAYVTPGSARRRGRPSTGSRRTLSQGAGRNAMGTCSRSTPPTSASSWL